MNNENPLERLINLVFAGYTVYLIATLLYYLLGIGIFVGLLCWIASL